MDLEELNKTQIILLTLLVSFVSAIATSIFTVKILEEAPPAVTQTINRIVERTIERVVPADPSTGTLEQTVIEKETTIVVKEDDLITESIDRNKRKIVRLVTITGDESTEASEEELADREIVFHGIGIIISEGGLIATASIVADVVKLVAISDSGKEYTTEVINTSGDISYLQIAGAEDETISLSPVTFVDETTLKLGQTVISIGGEERTSVSTGIIASFVEEEVVYDEVTETVLTAIRTNIGGSIPGSPLVNIFGEIVGIDVLQTPGVFTSSNLIQSGIQSQNAEEEVPVQTTESDRDTIEG